jgi:hypothetical protein
MDLALVLFQIALAINCARASGPVTDNFPGTSLSANWTTDDSTAKILAVSSGSVHGNSAAQHGLAHWNAVFKNDQFAQATITALNGSGSNTMGVSVRTSGSDLTNYFLWSWGNGVIGFFKTVHGTSTSLGDCSASTASVGNVLRIEASGSTITAKKNGVAICGSPVTDTDIPSGAPGIFGYDSGNSAINTWSGGNLDATSPQVSDNFTVPSSSLSTNWVPNLVAVTAGAAYAFEDILYVFWNARSFNPNQFAQATVGGIAIGGSGGAGVRITGDAWTLTPSCYFLSVSNGNVAFYKLVVGAYTDISASSCGAAANGDVLRIEASGSSITAKKNGVAICGSPVTDTALTSGAAGILFNATSIPSSPTVAAWQGGDLP